MEATQQKETLEALMERKGLKLGEQVMVAYTDDKGNLSGPRIALRF